VVDEKGNVMDVAIVKSVRLTLQHLFRR